VAVESLTAPLAALDGGELEALARVAERLLAGRPLYDPGPRPVRVRAGVGLEFLDVRDYTPGDDPRAIDWRATARSRRLQVRRHHHEAGADWVICVDRSASMVAADARKWTLAAELGAALAFVLLALGNRVGLALFSDRIDALCPPGRGQRHYASMTQTLQRHAPAASGGASALETCAPFVRRGVNLAVISDFLAPDAMLEGLTRLRQRSGALHALRVTSAADVAVAAGPATLVDAETAETLTVIVDPAAAAAAWAAHTSSFAALCAQLSITLTSPSVAQDWKAAVLEHLLAVEARRA
jgi:uncharacterized protein (DUF58 family)